MTRYELREYERQQTEKALRAVPPKVRVQPEYTLRAGLGCTLLEARAIWDARQQEATVIAPAGSRYDRWPA